VANREKDVAVLPILERTLRLAKRLKKTRTRSERPAQPGKRKKLQRKRP
jgi:hypothetical protein